MVIYLTLLYIRWCSIYLCSFRWMLDVRLGEREEGDVYGNYGVLGLLGCGMYREG